ncbi:hypothetical protein [Micromonospora cathayae]|uniref:Uncharacterized protein n=1 Tax=Micromonospora cathayae TaxID=3028804 RepID=A0ABY7ZKW7_9ACTN|nr:hypothetical protein [Micromonospora sp. HUAS 3]WDZ82932.1 hypothetical protein PVK37_20945 [Micromonospora sp. HUAS 3]
MTHRGPGPVRPGRDVRRWVADPFAPVLPLTAGALVAAGYGHPLSWALIGALTGYTLSGSV